MSNRRRPTRTVPLNPARTPTPPLPAVDARLMHVEWTDEPAAQYRPHTIDWIAARTHEIGRMNVWRCDDCGQGVLCYDRHPGTTPMVVSHATLGDPDCPGMCTSAFYSGVDAAVERERQGGPSHEWYRPSAVELRKESKHTREHVQLGGLLVREVADA